MKSNIESIFNLLKEKGLYPQYRDYAEYRKATEPAPEQETLEKTIEAQQEKNEQVAVKEKFEETLSDRDKSDFLSMFGPSE
jgi:bifunctional ADP-heptose synthase (sugar kinase/adenylyltransferase)